MDLAHASSFTKTVVLCLAAVGALFVVRSVLGDQGIADLVKFDRDDREFHYIGS